MVTFISFILVMAGCANWLIIGLMQYDFVAGVFGTQSSLLSRLIYIAIGVGAIWLVIMSFVQKGRIKINDNGFKKLNKVLPAPNSNKHNNNQDRNMQNEQRQDNQKQHYNQNNSQNFNHNQNNNQHNNQNFNNNHNSDYNEKQDYQRQDYNTSNTNNHQQVPPPNANSNIEAGQEFYQNNSQARKNPFD
jgi:uncharacterized membrane protein YuzA (DUF378 family)